MDKIRYRLLEPELFAGVIALGNQVHGDNYLDPVNLAQWHQRGCKNGINASFVALDDEQVIGFRLTWSAGQWPIDKWCSPQLWGVDAERVSYFKCNTVHADYRGTGVGSELLTRSIQQLQRQGSLAGIAHIWLASPGNSAFLYFSKNGGKIVQEHPNRWRDISVYEGYCCPVCSDICSCVAAEMLLTFDQQ